MSHRHLPAGQPMPGGGGEGGGVPGGVGSGGEMGPLHGGHNGHGGHSGHGSYGVHGNHGPQGSFGGHGQHREPRRRMPPPFQPGTYHHPAPSHMYGGYMNPYANQFYQQLPPQYQNSAMPSGYMNFQQPPAAYGRSPPSMQQQQQQQQQYVPMAGVSVPQAYPQPQLPQSPALATPYQPPSIPVPGPGSLPSQTPTSTHSSHVAAEPLVSSSESPAMSQIKQVTSSVAPQPSATTQSSVLSPPPSEFAPEPRQPFRPPIPWLSRPELPFPKASRRRRRKVPLKPDDKTVTLPVEQHENVLEQIDRAANQAAASNDAVSVGSVTTPTSELPRQTETASTGPGPASVTDNKSNASTKSQKAGQGAAADDTTKKPATSGSNVSTPNGLARQTTRPAVPAVPIIPAVPKSQSKSDKTPTVEDTKPATGENDATQKATAQPDTAEQQEAKEAPKPAPRAPPSSWSALLKSGQPAASKSHPAQNGAATSTANGPLSPDNNSAAVAAAAVPPASASNVNSVAAALQAFHVGRPEKVQFIQPRGLVNSGNMCYMNSILQVLLFCVPFYDLLDQVGQKVTHSFKSQTPILDAMILFMKEFPILASAESPEKLRKLMKKEQLEQYGESFTPEFIYQAIEPERRFENMRRGHQQDAQEFFGLLLQSLDDECARVVGAPGSSNGPSFDNNNNNDTTTNAENGASAGWLEVGARQKAAVTRSSGASSTTPISQIFSGLLRSELQVTGRPNSITTEPFQSLPLDIGAPDVSNVADAIKHLTHGERLEGNGFEARGGGSVTKRTVIDTLPPVLILHLKRFQFDAAGGISKVWKKIGYPLELEIPRAALSKQWQGGGGAGKKEIPKYRLIAVVYHHGKQASGGHYTVDVRRQDEQEWIRLDDTSIRRVRSEDVAEVGKEGGTGVSGNARKTQAQQQQSSSSSRDVSANRFGGMNDEDAGEQGEWTPVDKSNPWKKANGSGQGQHQQKDNNNNNNNKTPAKENVKDNKVAYLLFYQRV